MQFFGQSGICGPRTLQMVRRDGHTVYLVGEHHIQPHVPGALDIELREPIFPHITDVILGSHEPMRVYLELSMADCFVIQQSIATNVPQAAHRASAYMQQYSYRRSPLQRLAWAVAFDVDAHGGAFPNVQFVLCNKRHLHAFELLSNPKRLLQHWLVRRGGDLQQEMRAFDATQREFTEMFVRDIDTPHKLKRLMRQVVLPAMGELPDWWARMAAALALPEEAVAARVAAMKPVLRRRCIALVGRRVDGLVDDGLATRLFGFLKDCLARGREDCFSPAIQEFFRHFEMLIQDVWMMVEYEGAPPAAHHVFVVGDAHLRMLSPFFAPAGSSCMGWESDAYAISLARPPGPCLPSDADLDFTGASDARASVGRYLASQSHGGGGFGSNGGRMKKINVTLFTTVDS